MSKIKLLAAFILLSGGLFMLLTKSPSSIKEGDQAPDFELPTSQGGKVHLKDFRGKKKVILYFYPKDDTPGCTKEACHFRDQYEVFQEAGAEVIGVSSDSIQSHEQFSSKYNLPFILASDVKGDIRKRYGITSTLGLFPGRVTFVIDKEGIVRHVFSSQINMKKHVDEALATLKKLP